MEEPQAHNGISDEVVQLPTPTAWPLVLALGLTFGLAGLVTNAGISILGAVLIVSGCVGWFRQVWPHAQHVAVPVKVQKFKFTSMRTKVARIEIDESHRARLPVHTPSVMAGVKGGIAGGAAMIVPALLYGLIRYHSIWYAVNLLGGAGVAGWSNPTFAEITHFRLSALIFATIIHVAGSLLVGLLYGAMLPMLPRHPIMLGGIIAPLLWTGVLHATLGLINPYLDARIDWWWFVASQVTFGLVAGWVVGKQIHIRTEQYLPFAARVGLETPGMMDEDQSGGRTEVMARLLMLVFCMTVVGCGQLPGHPKPGPLVPHPDSVLDFTTLYVQNCSGCHGAQGMNGPSYPLANPAYQALVDEQILRQTIANGEPGTHMPPFAISAGGS